MASLAIPKPSESTTDGDVSIEDIASGVFAQILPKTTGATPAELAEHGIKQPAKEGTRQMVSYLKTIGDRLDQDTQFDGLMNRLDISADTVYDTFKEVALNIFRSGITWGRVAVLFMFGAKLAVRAFYDTPTIIKKLLEWVARFVTERLLNWITASGGWSALATFVAERFADSLTLNDKTDGNSTDGSSSSINLPLTQSNWRWLVVGVGIGIAVSGWMFMQKS